MARVTLDTGALIAVDRGDRRALAWWKEANRRGTERIVPAGALAQSWRGPRNARLAQAVRASTVMPLTAELSRRTGELCGAAGTDDVVDASIVVTAAASRSDIIVTGDAGDLRDLVAAGDAEVAVLTLDEIA